MPIADWARGLVASPELSEFLQDLDGPREWREIALEARPVLLASAYQKQPRKTLIITPTYERALQWQAKLGLCGITEAHVRQLPSGLSALFEDAAPETNAISERIGALRFLVEGGPGIIIGTPQSVLERTLPVEILKEAFLRIRPGDSIAPESILKSLKTLGYEYGEPVRIPGQFSQRGGIVDIFPMGRPMPVRIEMFGDEVESMRQFDPATQRSVGVVPMLILTPSRETLFPTGEDRLAIGDELLRSMQIEAAALPEEAALRLEEFVTADAKALDEHVFFDRLDLYRPLLHPDSACAIDLLPEDGWLVLDEPLELGMIAERSEEELAQALESRGKRGEILSSMAGDFMLPPEHLGSFDRVLALNAMGAAPDWLPSGTIGKEIQASSLESYRGRPEAFTQTLKNWLEAGFRVMLGTDQPTRAKAVLAQVELHPLEGIPSGVGVSPTSLPDQRPSLEFGTLQFIDPEEPILKKRSNDLPHWTQPGATYSVTFRLADAIPATVASRLRKEREELLRQEEAHGQLSRENRQRVYALFSDRVDKLLDSGKGKCILRDPANAKTVQDALLHFNGNRYQLWAWCIMPNHVHVVFTPDEGHSLESILHSWKSLTAHQMRDGSTEDPAIWQKESYDHLVRDDTDFLHCVKYTLSNPTYAGLKDWRWLGLGFNAKVVGSPFDFSELAAAAVSEQRMGPVGETPTQRDSRMTSVLVGETPTPRQDGALYLSNGNLAGGFVIPHSKLALVTDQELFGVGRLKLPQKRFNEGAPIATVLDLKPGDFVVHINFGIGMFQGLTKRVIDGVEKEYLYIQYAAPDKLFVPADQLDRIQKYLNPGDVAPKLNRLTGGEWHRTVGKAREEAREFARDLIKLYAQRKKVQRTSLGPDSPWQAEMEATFPWVETPSQMMAIKEAKKDLTLEYPMDRLICGDVGFGKTEVAIRAAFKVAQAGKQVAVLCPTTILSEQHYRNFIERLGAFPVRIEILNRFRSAAERTQIVKKLEAGEIDIIIGTHALLGKDLKFKELGLVVIDEEQKFGVKQKEALKALRVSVDILTLSATPIPRTLSMALMDIRQMSLINDPPPGRLPIRTFLRPHSDEVVREAVLREMARGGQVYYVYNRVQGIQHIAQRLQKLVPSAKIGVGHGQMTEEELEPVMIGFIKGELDVLLSTTIIENGLDIPNANTLIVDNSDRLGLAQLYQLRGRVGRSDRQAYAYLLYQKDRELTEGALQRLQSLQEFTSLGSGYSLAFRDLQIRGAGELLGSKQHGAMANVGYELYTQLIQEEVQFLKSHADGEKPTYNDPLEGLTPLPTFDLPVSALLPERYVPDQAQRLFSYKAIMGCRTLEELDDAFGDLEDRYGKPPEEVLNVRSIMRMRIQAVELGIEKVDGKGGRLAATLGQNAPHSPRVFNLLGHKNRESYVTRGVLIWPFVGSALKACQAMMDSLRDSIEEVEEERRSLGVEA